MTFPTVFRSVPNRESTLGNRARPKVAVPRSPLLCAPYRAQRWGTGNAMGAFPTPYCPKRESRGKENRYFRAEKLSDGRGNNSDHRESLFRVSAFSVGQDGGRSRWR